MGVIVGIDIGGTKCAISFAKNTKNDIEFLDKVKIPTETGDFKKAVAGFIQIIQAKKREHPDWEFCSIGISCGGPLDAKKGIIKAPPNLPAWEEADIFTPLLEAFSIPVMLQNDADACALAEWGMGAGKGSKNMIFLTFGTGMGAGLIINNELYSGTNGMAGEVGHIRLADAGPYGYGKNGSFEGFCSGNGIANLGKQRAKEALRQGQGPLFCPSLEELEYISSKRIASALQQGDKLAKEIFESVAINLGKGISILIDILNPEVIVIGSIFARQQNVLEEKMWEQIRTEALPESAHNCKILPAKLGEMIGDYAAVSVGIKAYHDFYKSYY
jgi:glucokinase